MYLQKGASITGDAGHNAIPDIGATGLRQEDVMTKEIIYLVNQKLKALGYIFTDITPYNAKFNSVGDSLMFRVNKANSIGSAFHLCMHFNVFNKVAHGVEVWVDPNADNITDQFAIQILNELVKLGFANRGVKEGDLCITKNTKMPCVLVEGCFCDNMGDMEIYNAEKMANAIVKGITGIGAVVPPVIVDDHNFTIRMTSNIQDVGIRQTTGINTCAIGTEGESKRLEMFVLDIDGVDFKYSIHEQDIGDTGELAEGQALGSVGMERRIEGITIKVINIPSGYKLQYRCHIQDIGTTEWVDSGTFCGTKGESKRVEKIEVRITKC